MQVFSHLRMTASFESTEEPSTEETPSKVVNVEEPPPEVAMTGLAIVDRDGDGRATAIEIAMEEPASFVSTEAPLTELALEEPASFVSTEQPPSSTATVMLLRR